MTNWLCMVKKDMNKKRMLHYILSISVHLKLSQLVRFHLKKKLILSRFKNESRTLIADLCKYCLQNHKLHSYFISFKYQHLYVFIFYVSFTFVQLTVCVNKIQFKLLFFKFVCCSIYQNEVKVHLKCWPMKLRLCQLLLLMLMWWWLCLTSGLSQHQGYL